MSDNGEADTEEPAVPLGDGDPVEGAPTARVTSRLYFPIEESEVLRREGETTIRTPDGPRDLADVLAESDEVYFPDRQSFVDTVQGVIGTGPIPTEGDDGSTGGDTTSAEETDAEGAADADADAGAQADAEAETGEPDNAAEAPEGAAEGTPDDDNAAEAPEDGEGGDEPAADGADEGAPDDEETIEDDGGFEFDDPAE